MKICFVAPQYLPTSGGVERYTANLADELQKRGHDVQVITSLLAGMTPKQTQENGVEVVRLPSLGLLRGRFPVTHLTLSNLQHLKQLLNEADWIVIQTRFYPLSILAARICRKLAKNAIIVEHGSGHLKLGSGLMLKLVEWYEHFWMHYVSKQNHNFFAVSRAGLDWLEHFHVKGKGVLYNAVDFAFIQSCAAQNPNIVLQQYQLPSGKPLVFFAGRLVKEKGILQLIEAVRRLHPEIEAQLVIAGSGDLEQTIAGMEEPWVHLLGSLSQKDLFELLSLGGIFCLPSDSEGMSTAVLEAAACGCFVITTDRGGSKELICGAEYGTVIEKNDVESIYESLRNALLDPKECQKCAERAKERVKDTFSFVTTANALESAFQSFEQ